MATGEITEELGRRDNSNNTYIKKETNAMQKLYGVYDATDNSLLNIIRVEFR